MGWENDRIALEQANLELRLAQQEFFHNLLGDVKKRSCQLQSWKVATLLSGGLVWGMLLCPVLHRVGWCPFIR